MERKIVFRNLIVKKIVNLNFWNILPSKTKNLKINKLVFTQRGSICYNYYYRQSGLALKCITDHRVQRHFLIHAIVPLNIKYFIESLWDIVLKRVKLHWIQNTVKMKQDAIVVKSLRKCASFGLKPKSTWNKTSPPSYEYLAKPWLE